MAKDIKKDEDTIPLRTWKDGLRSALSSVFFFVEDKATMAHGEGALTKPLAQEREEAMKDIPVRTWKDGLRSALSSVFPIEDTATMRHSEGLLVKSDAEEKAARADIAPPVKSFWQEVRTFLIPGADPASISESPDNSVQVAGRVRAPQAQAPATPLAALPPLTPMFKMKSDPLLAGHAPAINAAFTPFQPVKNAPRHLQDPSKSLN